MKTNITLEISGKARAFVLQDDETGLLIGRKKDNAITLTDDPGVSKVHSRVYSQGGVIYVIDAGSRNGTFVNDQLVTDPWTLQEGDVIRVGNTDIRFSISSTPSRVTDKSFPTGGPSLSPSGMTCILNVKDIDSHARMPLPTAADSTFYLEENRRLSVLQDIAASLLDQKDLTGLFNHCLELIHSVIPSTRGCLMMLEGGELRVKALRGGEPSSNDILRFSNTVRRLVVEQKSAVLTANVEGDPLLEGAHSIIIQGIKSVICVPLWNGDRTYGLIYLDSAFHERAYNEKNLRLLTAIANLVTMKIENFLYIQELLEKKALEKELQFASDVQHFLLQPQFPAIPGYDSAIFYQSCHQLGGDYYHCFPLSDGRFLCVIADVMGKGTGAALLTSSLHAYLSTFCDGELELGEIIARLNHCIHDLCEGTFFITLLALLIEPGGGMVRFVNAGHNDAVLVRSDGRVEFLSEGGVLLGMSPEMVYTVGEAQVAGGDVIALYTDGLSEMENTAGDMLGKDFIVKHLRDNRGLSCRELSQALIAAARGFCAGCAAKDDTTTIIVKRCDGGAGELAHHKEVEIGADSNNTPS